jgi:hypothetical protein
MPEIPALEEMLKKIADAVCADLGPAYQEIVLSKNMALAIASKLSLTLANMATSKMLDRSSQRVIREWQDNCLQQVYLAAISSCFQNKALLAKIQTIMVAAVSAQNVKTAKE